MTHDNSRRLADLESVFDLGDQKAGHVQLWSPSVMAWPVIRRIELKLPGHSFRYAVDGAGLIQLHLNGQSDGVIYPTHCGHWNKAGARERSKHSADDCDWEALAKLSGLIQRHIRRRLAAAKLYARLVLHQAFSAFQQRRALSFGPTVHHANSPDIHRVATRPPASM